MSTGEAVRRLCSALTLFKCPYCGGELSSRADEHTPVLGVRVGAGRCVRSSNGAVTCLRCCEVREADLIVVEEEEKGGVMETV